MPARSWIAVVSFFCGVFLCVCNPNTPLPAPTPIPTLAPAETLTLAPEIQPTTEATGVPALGKADEAALGAPIYLGNCTPCHGNQGEGVDSPPLRDNQYVQAGGEQDLVNTIAEGVSSTEMPAWLQANGGPLVDAEISQVVAYLYTLQGALPLPSATPMPPEPTPTALPPNAPTPEPARPSEPGGPGPAASTTGDPERGRVVFGAYCAACHGPEGVQGIPNPGSDDESVPVLNPIDPTLVSSDPQVFAANVDLFIEHGSVPAGPGPLLVMPDYGDSDMLDSQQIADLIAYILRLNGTK